MGNSPEYITRDLKLQRDFSNVVSMRDKFEPYEYAVFIRTGRPFAAVKNALIEILWSFAKWLAH
jgi:hypothetical protein